MRSYRVSVMNRSWIAVTFFILCEWNSGLRRDPVWSENRIFLNLHRP